MTVEEIEIIVTAKVEEALKEFQKILPTIKQSMKQAQEAFSKVDTKTMTNKLHQAVNFMKKKMQDLKKSNENNEIAIKVNNKDAQKQISQIQKQIDSLQEKINARQIKLDVINPQIDKIVDDTRKNVTPQGINPNDKSMDTTVNNALGKNKDFTSLNSQAQKLYTEIEMYNKQLSEAKSKMAQLGQETNKTATTQSKLSSFFGSFKQKIAQVKPSISSIGNSFKTLPKITQNITNNIKGMGTGLKQGLRHVIRYAMALFSLRGIYSVLSNSAQSWLSSQNAGAKQLSANIEYMKYAMGSVFAPVIEYVVNLVYQLMKAIQSVVYAFSGINIFAKATASSMNKTAGSANKASKSLAGVHNEINNISENNSSGGSNSANPSFDLSQMDNTPNSIVDAIKNGNWYEVGATIGEKLNDAMNNIPWEKIHKTAGNIGTGIADTLNGFISTTDWNQVGNTFAQGINTFIYVGYNFITTFDWKQFGTAIGDSINGFLSNIDWATAGQTLGEGIKGIFNAISSFLSEVDWTLIGESVKTFIQNIDWIGIWDAIKETIKSAIGSADGILTGLFGENTATIIETIAIAIGLVTLATKLFSAEKLKETGILIANAATWIAANLPIILITAAIAAVIAIIILCVKHWDEIKETVTNVCNKMKETVSNWVKNIGDFFSNLKTNIVNKVNEIKDGIKNKFQEAYNGIKNIFSNIGNFFSGIWNNVKNTFSALGTKIGDAISGAVKSGINGVISLIERTINSAIRLINGGIKLINLIPGVTVGTINTLSLPRLAKGGVLTEATAVIAGEYSGAKSNPEIVTPQNIMRETMEDVFSDYIGSSGQAISLNLTVNVSDKKLGQILLEDLRDMKRQTGQDIEALVGG